MIRIQGVSDETIVRRAPNGNSQRSTSTHNLALPAYDMLVFCSGGGDKYEGYLPRDVVRSSVIVIDITEPYSSRL